MIEYRTNMKISVYHFYDRFARAYNAFVTAYTNMFHHNRVVFQYVQVIQARRLLYYSMSHYTKGGAQCN